MAENGGAVARYEGEPRLFVDLEPVPAISRRHGDGDHAAPCARTMSSSFKEPPRVADHVPLSGPVQLAASTGFAWAKKPRPDATTAAAAVTKRSGSKGPGTNNTNNGGGDGARTTSAAAAAPAAAAPYEVESQEMIKQWAQVADAFSASEAYNSRFRQTLDAKQLKTGKVSPSHLTITSIADLQCSAVSLIVSLRLNLVTLMHDLGILLLFADVQGEGEQGRLLRAAAVTAPAHRRAPAQPRAADPASWSPVMVQERCLAY